MDPTEIVAGFNQQNDKKHWRARAYTRSAHFIVNGGMVALVYDCDTNRFAVKFNRFQGAWGDYIKAIARGLYVVLNTLKSAGLPFEAPTTLAGMVITAATGADNTVYVAWSPNGAAETPPVTELAPPRPNPAPAGDALQPLI